MSDFSDLAHPLHWPAGVKRTPSHEREHGRFGRQRETQYNWRRRGELTLAEARDRVIAELERMGAGHWVISTDLALRRDGLPRSGQRKPDDPGVAVYCSIDGQPHCFPCDRYLRIEDNLAAIAKHLEALRGIARWGVGEARQAYAGYRALPPAGESAPARDWREVLKVGLYASPSEIRDAYRRRARECHPDVGGNAEAMAAINAAWEQAKSAGVVG